MRNRLPIAAGILLVLGLCALFLADTPDADREPRKTDAHPATDLGDEEIGDPEQAASGPGGSGGRTGGSKDLRITGAVMMRPDLKPLGRVEVTAHDRAHLFEGAPWVREILTNDDWVFLVDIRPHGPPVAKTLTDEDGAFALDVPGEGPFSVIASKAVLGSDAAVAHAGDHVQLRLGKLRARRIRLFDPEGSPVAGVEVLAFARFEGEPPRTRSRSDMNGETLLHAGNSDMVLLRRAGFETRLLWAGNLSKGIPIVLERGSPFAGEVRDPEGRPVEGAAVLLQHPIPELRITGPEGRFSFDGACASLYGGIATAQRGWLGLVVMHPEFVREEMEDLPEQGDLIVTLSRRGTASISGRILVAKGTRPELEAWLEPLPWDRGVVIRDDGSFLVTDLPPGDVDLALTCEKSVPTFWGGRESCISHYGEVTVTLEAGQHLEGIVIEPEKLDVSFVAPRAVDPDGRHLELMRFGTREPGTSVSGMWFALSVPPGSNVAFTVRPPRTREFAVGTEVSLVTSADPSVPPVDVVVRRNPLFLFELVDEAGRPVPSKHVHLSFAQDGSTWGARRDRVGGSVLTSHLDPGKAFRVKADAKGYGTVVEYRGPPDPEHPRQKIVFAPESTLRGRLVTSDGRLVRRAYLEVNRPIEGRRPAFLARTEDLDAEGRFSFGGLPAGRVRVSAFVKSEFGGRLLAETTLVLPRGGTADAGSLVMGSLPEVHGFVADGEGRTLAGVLVRYLDESGDWYESLTTTKSDGSFRLSVPRRPGSCVEFERTGFRMRKLDLTPDHFENPVTICLTPGSE